MHLGTANCFCTQPPWIRSPVLRLLPELGSDLSLRMKCDVSKSFLSICVNGDFLILQNTIVFYPTADKTLFKKELLSGVKSFKGEWEKDKNNKIWDFP